MALTYFAPMGFEKVQARMAGYLAYEPPLLVEIHSLEIGFVVGEDLIGLWDNPDLVNVSLHPANINFERHASELSSSITGRGRYCTGFRLNNTCWTCEFRPLKCIYCIISGLGRAG